MSSQPQTILFPTFVCANPTEETIRRILQELASTRYDKVAKTHQVQLEAAWDEQHQEEDSQLHYLVLQEGSRRYLISQDPLAYSQLLNRLNLPAKLFQKISIPQAAEVFNHQASRKDLGVLLRFHSSKQEKIPRLRAVLSSRYGIIDDVDLFPMIIDALKEEAEPHVYRGLVSDSRITVLTLTFPNIQAEYDGQTLTAGIMATNSEVGQSAVWIEPIVYWNTTGFVSRQDLVRQGLDMRLLHRGEFNKARVIAMTKQMKDIAQVGIVQLAEAWEQQISKVRALSFAKGIDSLPKRIQAILEEEWSSEEEVSKAAVAARIMALAAELPLFQQAQVNQAACKITGIFDNYRERMSQILSEIEQD